jgi:HlyD family secretion protein
MKKYMPWFLGALFIGLFIWTLIFLYNKSSEQPVTYSTEKPSYQTIINKTVATGSIVPREMVEVKPQISGIVQELYVVEGQKVKSGDPMARVRVVPNMANLNGAENRVGVAEINLKNAKLDYDRNQRLLANGVIAQADFQGFEVAYQNARQEMDAARKNLEIVREGTYREAGKSSVTIVKATVDGMVLEVPVKVGDQVIESNTFNAGTSVAKLANMGDMIFEGFVDESEVGKIKEGMPLLLTIGAIEGKRFDATLEFISPQGTEKNGAIQFKIKARVATSDEFLIRAGLSANADVVLGRRDSVLAIRETLLQFDDKKQPYVEISKGNQQFERRDVKTGLSDGLYVEVLEGIKPDEEIKIWNATVAPMAY